MWRMPPPTNASYVGRFAPPGSPKTTSTPSALRHSITASTARMSLLGPFRWAKKPVYQRVFRLSGDAEADADREADDAPDGDEHERVAHRDVQEPVADPRDCEQLDCDDRPGDDQRLFPVGDEEGQGVKDPPENRHPAGDRSPYNRRAAPGFLARVRAR